MEITSVWVFLCGLTSLSSFVASFACCNSVCLCRTSGSCSERRHWFAFLCADDGAEEAETTDRSPRTPPSHEHQSTATSLKGLCSGGGVGVGVERGLLQSCLYTVLHQTMSAFLRGEKVTHTVACIHTLHVRGWSVPRACPVGSGEDAPSSALIPRMPSANLPHSRRAKGRPASLRGDSSVEDSLLSLAPANSGRYFFILSSLWLIFLTKVRTVNAVCKKTKYFWRLLFFIFDKIYIVYLRLNFWRGYHMFFHKIASNWSETSS